MPECKGGRLDTLPPTPSLTTVTVSTYKLSFPLTNFLNSWIAHLNTDREVETSGMFRLDFTKSLSVG